MDPAAMMAMMQGRQAKPEPWTLKVKKNYQKFLFRFLIQNAGKALAGVAIFAAVGTYVWDSRGAPLEKIATVKTAMAACGYYVSGLPFTIPIINDFY